MAYLAMETVYLLCYLTQNQITPMYMFFELYTPILVTAYIHTILKIRLQKKVFSLKSAKALCLEACRSCNETQSFLF